MNRKHLTIQCVLLFTIIFFFYNLEDAQKWGLPIVLALQQHRNTFVDLVMHLFTTLGYESNIFLILPIMLWSGDHFYSRVGVNVVWMLNFSLLMISCIKLSFVEDRPYWALKDQLKEPPSGGNFEHSFPSAHAWVVATTMLYLAKWFSIKSKNPTQVWVACGVVMAGASFSRVWFGAHYLHDVIVGLCGGSLIYFQRKYFVIYDSVESEIANGKPVYTHYVPPYKVKLMIQTGLLIVAYIISLILFNPEDMKKQLSFFYALGTTSGCILSSGFVQRIEDNHSTWYRLAARMILGTALPMIFIITTGFAFHKSGTNLMDAISFTYGLLITPWTFYLGPQVLAKLGLGHLSKHPNAGHSGKKH